VRQAARVVSFLCRVPWVPWHAELGWVDGYQHAILAREWTPCTAQSEV
jgi:hypothetical protein